MSDQNPILSAIGQGRKLDVSTLPTMNDCGGKIAVQDWNVSVFDGQLQGTASLVPSDSLNAIVTATLIMSSGDGRTIYTSAVATVVGGGAPGQQVSLQTYTDLFDAATNGSTVTAVISGFMLGSTGCSFYFTRQFDVNG